MWLKYFKTVCLCFAFLSLGISIAIIGPTLPTLAYNLQVNIDSISVILPARGGGYLVGSILSGFIYGKIEAHMMMFIAMIIMAVGIVTTPFWNYVALVAMAISTTGIAMGFLDTAGNVLCLQTWGEKSGPFMQTLHFSFAVGTTAAPLIAQPFIRHEKPLDISTTTYINPTANNATPITTIVNDRSVPFIDEAFPLVSFAFIIASAFGLLIALSFLYLTCCFRNDTASDQKDTIKEEGIQFRMKMLIFLFLFFLVYVGVEVTFGVYIYSFATRCSNKYPKDLATLVNTLFWGAFAVGRLLAIPASKIFKPAVLLHFDLIGTFSAAIILCFFPYYAKTFEGLFWFAIGLYGVSMASIFPTGISWAEQYITINGRAAVALVVGAALGEMICPFIIGQFLESNPMNLMYFCMTCASLSVLNYFVLRCVANTRGKRLKYDNKNVEDKIDNEEVEELMNPSPNTHVL